MSRLGFLRDLGACIGVFLVALIGLAAFSLGLLMALVFLIGFAVLGIAIVHEIWKHRQPEPFDDKLFHKRSPRAFETAFPEMKEKEKE